MSLRHFQIVRIRLFVIVAHSSFCPQIIRITGTFRCSWRIFMLCIRRSVMCLSLAVAIIPVAVAQQSPLRPHSMYEPPAAKAAASLAASSAGVSDDLLTTGEKTQWQKTGLYAETVAMMRKMERMSPFVKVEQFGTTSEGRPMYIMIVSSDKAFTP